MPVTESALHRYVAVNQPLEPDHRSSASAARMRILVIVLAAAGLWVARAFVLQIAFAFILATAVWPLYRRLGRAATKPERKLFLPLAFTLAIGLILTLPLMVVATEAVRDSQSIAAWTAEAERTGIPAPSWLAAIPLAGHWLLLWWDHYLADPRGFTLLLGGIDPGDIAVWFAFLAGEIVWRIAFLAVTLLSLFLTLRSGERLGDTACAAAGRLYGRFGETFVSRLGEAVRGTVNGTILIAVSEGTLIGLGYAVAGFPHPVVFTIITIGFALIPFGAWAAFGAASLVLVLEGQALAGALLFAYGSAIMLVGDNLVQPALIGNSIRLPFLWTFVGIFGGMYSFGLVGLFIGPAIMAGLYLVWSDWMDRSARRPR
jgi:predicted PurR-regulated permease PerM